MIDIYLTQQEPIDLNNIPLSKEQKVVSFDIDVLDKYRNDSAYLIPTTTGVLTCSAVPSSWHLQVDVGNTHISTFLYCLSSLPSSEIAHFMQYNIYPVELSQVACQRWRQGTP